MTELVTVQKWLQAFIVDPGTDEEALLSAEAAAGLGPNSAENMILPSPTLQPAERIQIYRNMYLLRMEEALEMDFPVIQYFVGERPFFNLVAEYVEAYPSRSWTLDHLGRHFAKFLGECEGLEHKDFLHDMARVEWALCDAFNAPNSTSIQMTDLANVDPEDFEKLILKPIPSLQVVPVEHNVNAYYKKWVAEETPPEPTALKDWLVIWRDSTDFKRWRLGVSEAGNHFLSILLAQKTLGEALEDTIEKYEVPEAELFEWFSGWVGEGFFSTYTFG